MKLPRRTKSVIPLILFLLGILSGVGLYWYTNNNSDSNRDNSTAATIQDTDTRMTITPTIDAFKIDTPASNLHVNLLALNKQHITLITTASRSTVDIKPDMFALKDALNKNTSDLSATIGKAYGSDAQRQFQELWTSNINNLLNYAAAMKKRDTIAIEQLNPGFVKFEEDYASFINTYNPELTKDSIKSFVSKYIASTKGVVDEYIPCNFENSIAKQAEAYEVIGQYSSTLAKAIISKYGKNL